MYVLENLKKTSEGIYTAQSKPCPNCMTRLTVEIKSEQLFKYNQGALIQDVLPELDAGSRERFMSGYCDNCWSAMFADIEDES